MTPALTLRTLLLTCFFAGPVFAETSARRIEYNREIRPILSENCFTCHGADSAARKAKLRLDKFEDATAKHEDSPAAIMPGKPEQSEMIRRIFDPGDDLMPPEKSHKELTLKQKNLLKRWVAEGAKYELQWSLIPPTRPELPPVKKTGWYAAPLISSSSPGSKRKN